MANAPPLPRDPLAILNAPQDAVFGPVVLVGAVLAAHLAGGLLCLALSVGGRASLPLVPRPGFSGQERRGLRLSGAVFTAIPLLGAVFVAAPVVGGIELAGLVGVVGAVVVVVFYVLGGGYLVSVLVPPLSSTGAIVAAFSVLPGLLAVDFVGHWLSTAPALQTTVVAMLADLVVIAVAFWALSATVPAIAAATGEWIVFGAAAYLVVASWRLAGLFAPSLPTLFAVLAVVGLVPVLVAVRGYIG